MQLMVVRLLIHECLTARVHHDLAVTGGVKIIMTEISILIQGEGFNCETNETSGDGSWSNVAAQKDWILDQLDPERRTGLDQI